MHQATLDSVLAERRERSVVAVQALLEQLTRLDRWLAGPLPEGLAQHLGGDRRRLADELTALLLDWYAAGGGIDLLEIDTAGYIPSALGPAEPDLAEPDLPGSDLVMPDLAAPAPEAPDPAEPDLPGSELPWPDLPGSDLPGSDLLEPDLAEPDPGATTVTAPDLVVPVVLDLSGNRTAPPPPPAAPPPSRTELEALAAHARGGGFFAGGPATAPAADALAGLLRELSAAQDEALPLAQVEHALSTLHRWLDLPGDTQVLLGEWLTAELRALQESRAGTPLLVHGIRDLAAHQRRHQAGYVHGLALHHRPRGKTWAADAQAAWAQLCTIAGDDDDTDEVVAPGRPAPAKPRRVRPAPEDETDRDAAVPPDWGWWCHTRGRRAVIVGGDPREPNRQRLEAAFEFAELRWEKAEGSRNSLQKVRDRVRAGGVDLVILLSRFIGHDADEVIQPACKEHGVPFVPVPRGYGVVGVKLALERHLPPPSADDTVA